jgi:hypothetical protein
VIATAILLFAGPDARLEELSCAMTALRTGDSGDRYMVVRYPFEQFVDSGDHGSVAYRAAFMGAMAELLRRKDLDDSTRLEVCHGALRVAARAGPLVPALGDYLADLKARRVNRERGLLRAGSGMSAEELVQGVIQAIHVRAPPGAGEKP